MSPKSDAHRCIPEADHIDRTRGELHGGNDLEGWFTTFDTDSWPFADTAASWAPLVVPQFPHNITSSTDPLLPPDGLYSGFEWPGPLTSSPTCHEDNSSLSGQKEWKFVIENKPKKTVDSIVAPQPVDLSQARNETTDSQRSRVCPLCGSVLARKYELIRHLSKVHTARRMVRTANKDEERLGSHSGKEKPILSCGYCCAAFGASEQWADHVANIQCKREDVWLVENQLLGILRRFVIQTAQVRSQIESQSPDFLGDIQVATSSELKHLVDELESSTSISPTQAVTAVNVLRSRGICEHQILDPDFVAVSGIVKQCNTCARLERTHPDPAAAMKAGIRPPSPGPSETAPRTSPLSGPYVCDHDSCGRKFVRISELQRHTRFHLPYGRRSYVCDKCSARFVFNKDLRRHQYTHDRPRISCPTCGRMFSRKDHIKRHQLRCAGTVPTSRTSPPRFGFHSASSNSVSVRPPPSNFANELNRTPVQDPIHALFTADSNDPPISERQVGNTYGRGDSRHRSVTGSSISHSSTSGSNSSAGYPFLGAVSKTYGKSHDSESLGILDDQAG